MDGFYGIFRTRRVKPARGGEKKPQGVLVYSDTKYNEIFNHTPSRNLNPFLFYPSILQGREGSLYCGIRFSNSLLKLGRFISAVVDLQSTTTFSFLPNLSLFLLKTSRTALLIRFRMTAFFIPLPTFIPNLGPLSSSRKRWKTIRFSPLFLAPRRKVCLNSDSFLMRIFLGNPSLFTLRDLSDRGMVYQPETVKRALFLARRRLKVFLPPLVDIRFLKPWSLTFLILEG